MTTTTKPMSELIGPTLATLGSLPTRKPKDSESPRQSPAKIIHSPCRTPWQQKWLKLDCHCPAVQALADRAQAFAKRWYREDARQSLLVLVGESGCGKSHVASALFRFALAISSQILRRGNLIPGATFCRWPETVDSFKAGDYSVMRDLTEDDLVFLDDIGAEHDPSKNGVNVLCQILSHRERKFTVITSNIPPAQWPEKFDTRIADRLMRNSDVVDLFGVPSYSVNLS